MAAVIFIIISVPFITYICDSSSTIIAAPKIRVYVSVLFYVYVLFESSISFAFMIYFHECITWKGLSLPMSLSTVEAHVQQV